MAAGPYKLGLTGSIGMGKSTTAAMFTAAGIPVWDADFAVALLYGAGNAGAGAIAALIPDAVDETGVNRAALRAAIARDDGLLPQIEAVIHPLLARDRAAFVARHADAPLVVFDLPLLFETGADSWLDGVLVVSAPPAIQRARVLARPGMTPEFLDNILARQLSDAEKRTRADWVIDTAAGIAPVRDRVLALIAEIQQSARHA